jgi:hypothetical protein
MIAEIQGLREPTHRQVFRINGQRNQVRTDTIVFVSGHNGVRYVLDY